MSSDAISFPDILMRWLEDNYPDAFRLTKTRISFINKDKVLGDFEPGDTLSGINKFVVYHGSIERKMAVYSGSPICAFVVSCGVICKSKDGKKMSVSSLDREIFNKLEVHFNSWL